MNRKLARPVFAALLAALLSASCKESAPAGPIVSNLVPAEAIAAAIVESPYKLYAEAEKFWAAASLDQVAGGGIEESLLKSAPQIEALVPYLDFARPWALSVVPLAEPGAAAGKKVRMLFSIPYRDEKIASSEAMSGSGLNLVAKASGYIVLSDIEGAVAFPPAKGADLSRLSRYPAAAIKAWGDPEAIRLATSDSYKPIHEAIRGFVTDPAESSSSPTGQAAAATKAMEELLLSFLGQLDLADASVELGSGGLTIRVGASAAKGSDLQKALLAGSLAPAALQGAALVDPDAMYGLAWSMDPLLASGLYDRFSAGLFSSLGLGGDIAPRASALMAKWAKAAGPGGAMSFDMDLDAQAIAAAGDIDSKDSAAIADFIKKAFKLRFDYFQDIKDEAAYKALLKGMASDPDYQAYAKAYADAFGLSFSIKSQDKKDGAFAYGELAFDFEVTDPAKMGGLSDGDAVSKAGSEAALAAIESLTSTRWAISNGRFVATSGDLAALKALAARKAASQARSLASDPAFAAFAKTMPPKQLYVGSFSVKRLMTLISSLAKAEKDGASSLAGLPDPGLFGSWYSYLSIDSRGAIQGKAPGLEFGLLVPAGDIGALAKSGGSLMKMGSSPKEGI
jgi:hypothetical protein